MRCKLDQVRAGSTAALFDPGFYLGSIPDDAPGCEIETPWKFAALFHLVNRSVCERYHLPQLAATHRAGENFSHFGRRDFGHGAATANSLKRRSLWLALAFVPAATKRSVECLFLHRWFKRAC